MSGNKLLIGALLPALLVPLSAQASKWTPLGTRDQARIEIDLTSLHSPSEGRTRVWSRENYAKPKVPDSGAFSFSRLTTLTEFQCEKRLASTIQLSYAGADGSDLKTESPESREARPVAPDSGLEMVFDRACKTQSKPAAKAPVAPPPVAPAPAPAAEEKETPKKTKNGKKEAEPPPPHTPHWTYTGASGADKWGTLGPEFAVCGTGQRQSPIDIRHTVRADLPPIQFPYKPVPLSIVDNGHTIKVDTPGAGNITVNGESFELIQFHFHKPSEEKINGKVYDMVVHLVHQSKEGKLAVVGVLMEAGKEQPLIRTLWTHLPLEQDKLATHPDVKIDPAQLLPKTRTYYTFMGSLTTPPCTEGVLWMVMKTPLQVAKEQLAGFGTIYKSNVRPVQAVNNRLIKESR